GVGRGMTFAAHHHHRPVRALTNAGRDLTWQTRTAAMVAMPEKLQDAWILITDDDVSSRDALRDVLMVQGYRTVVASCGEEAVDVVQVATVHLVLMDM